MYYEKVIAELNKSGVRYLVAGGTAIVLHGIVRMTADLDIMVSLDKKNVEKLVASIEKLGYTPKAPVKAIDLADPEKRALWMREKGMKVFSFFEKKMPIHMVDVFVYEPIDFEGAYGRRKIVDAGGLRIPVVSLDDLERMKAIAGREMDLADIKSIRELKKIRKDGN